MRKGHVPQPVRPLQLPLTKGELWPGWFGVGLGRMGSHSSVRMSNRKGESR